MTQTARIQSDAKNANTQKLVAIWILFTLLFIGELFLYTWCRVQCVNVGYLISRETQRQDRLVQQRNRLNVELARLKSPQRIAGLANQYSGLRLPQAGQVISLP